LPVPQVVVQRMSDAQVQRFLQVYLPSRADSVWKDLQSSPQLLDLFRNPYYLRLLVDQVGDAQAMPRGRAGLFTGFVRKSLHDQISDRQNQLLLPDALLDERDHTKLASNQWSSPFDLPVRGLLIPCLSQLAFRMQEITPGTDSHQVTIGYDDACCALHGEHGRDIARAGRGLSILDEDLERDEVKFFHQLLQEYFAARRLARHPDPGLVRVEWRADRVSPSLKETLEQLADSDPLPPLPATGWEETTVLAAAMAGQPSAFVRDIMAANLPLAARCAANPEARIDDALKRIIQQALIARMQDRQADLRARIAAGLALGELGDPRFERRTRRHGDYLLPPLVTIPAGEYPIGSDDGDVDERPIHAVQLPTFQTGMFPVTNAEYALFMASGGYEDERWWDTDAAKAWRRGEGSTEGQKRWWRERRRTIQQSLEWIRSQVGQRYTSREVEVYRQIDVLTDEEFEQALERQFPEGRRFTEPRWWDDSNFNNPAQPVVGVSWFEARAYCRWLAAQSGRPFRLPGEAEREAAARGLEGRRYAYGETFDAARCNTFETHIPRTAPVGVFPGGETPEGACDLTGNVWDWTSTIYDQERFPYPYRADDGREDPEGDAIRVVRGGSWNRDRGNARAANRRRGNPLIRGNVLIGFRVVCRPPSH
jgi:formylglycine-generating enzyme required for sulfatase activity